MMNTDSPQNIGPGATHLPVSDRTTCEVWTQRGLVEHITEHDRKMHDRRFAFILGAGASVSSGIPDAGKLVRRWVAELHTRHAPAALSIDQWATAENLGVAKFAWAEPAESYCHIYKRRFRGDPDEGFADLECEMLGKKPGRGYAILAYLLAETRHNLVITTNFDSLIQDAMFMYTSKVPQVCGHEALATFFNAKSRRATIAKIHRDLLMSPMSQSEEVGELQAAWREPLARAFLSFTPIVIGYGGNDGSLMGFLSSMDPAKIQGRLFWCYHLPSGPPRDSIRTLVSSLNGVLVPLERGFDGLMEAIGEKMGLPRIEAILDARLTEFREHAANLAPRMGTSSTGLAPANPDEPLIAAPAVPVHPESEPCAPCDDEDSLHDTSAARVSEDDL